MNKCISNEARSASEDFGQRIHTRHTQWTRRPLGATSTASSGPRWALFWRDEWTSGFLQVLITISYLILMDGREKALMISNRAKCGHTEGLLLWSGSAKPFCWQSEMLPLWNWTCSPPPRTCPQLHPHPTTGVLSVSWWQQLTIFVCFLTL